MVWHVNARGVDTPERNKRVEVASSIRLALQSEAVQYGGPTYSSGQWVWPMNNATMSVWRDTHSRS